jgi:hypothetical protein
MRFKHIHPDQIPFEWSKDTEIERIIEARVAIRCEAAALRWRFRLILIESVMIASLVLTAGIVLEQPTFLVVRGAAILGGSCFITGLTLIGLTVLTNRLLARWRRRK